MKHGVLVLLLLGCILTAPAQYISHVNKATLAVLREQKKLARDVYDSLYAKWELRIFEEIGGAEMAHMEAVKPLLDQFAVEDPIAITGDERGRFAYRPFQRLYDSLVVSGTASMVGALRTGAFVEEMDIVDLQRAIQSTGADDLRAIYKYLLMAAQRHLLTFTRYLKKVGVPYEPVLLSAREYGRLIGASGGGMEK